MDAVSQELLDSQSPTMKAVKKTPRKPRPSEIAAKAAKKAKAVKPAKAKRPKVVKRKPAPKKAKKKAKVSDGIIRTARLDLRLTKKEKAKVLAKAKALRRTVTSIFVELIEKLK